MASRDKIRKHLFIKRDILVHFFSGKTNYFTRSKYMIQTTSVTDLKKEAEDFWRKEKAVELLEWSEYKNSTHVL